MSENPWPVFRYPERVPDGPKRALMNAYGEAYEVAEKVVDAQLRAVAAQAKHDAICWVQPDPAHGQLIACDRKKDHLGKHSWEIDPPVSKPVLIEGELRDWIEVHAYVVMPRGLMLLGEKGDVISKRLCQALEAEYISQLTLIRCEPPS